MWAQYVRSRGCWFRRGKEMSLYWCEPMGGEHNMKTAINFEINGEDALKCKIAICF